MIHIAAYKQDPVTVDAGVVYEQIEWPMDSFNGTNQIVGRLHIGNVKRMD